MIGSWIMSGSAVIAESCASSDLIKWVCVDLEHSSIDYPSLENCVRAIKLRGKEAYVRISGHDYTQVKRVLDIGADGLIIPDIRRPEELDAIIRSAFYHPTGSRGVGLYRAQLAMENLGEILNFEKLSGVFIGPYDLSSSLGIPGDFTNPEFLKNIKRFEYECSKSNKLMGMHIVYPNNTLLREKIAKGYNFIAYGTDLLLLQESFNQIEL
jgi:2-dehydro-3-deoxyglucarate aldolase